MVHLQDEPIADPVCVPVYYVSKLARDNGVIVAQVGEGADELFCGYPLVAALSSFSGWDDLPVPRVLRSRLAWHAALARPGRWACATSGSGAARRASRSSGAAPKRSPSGRRSACCATTSGDFAGHDIVGGARADPHAVRSEGVGDSRTQLDDLRRPQPAPARAPPHAGRQDEHGRQPGRRVPFLDHQFVELAMSIPTES